jgi:hypothetical protein
MHSIWGMAIAMANSYCDYSNLYPGADNQAKKNFFLNNFHKFE